jgi:sugar lactone lactonase YvrE
VIPVQGTKTQQLLTTRGHDVIVFNWNQENARFDSSANSKNFSVIARVETNPDKSGNRWNDGKADAKGRLWAGMSPGHERLIRQHEQGYNASKSSQTISKYLKNIFGDILAN